MPVPDETIDAFQTEGVAVVRGAFRDWIGPLSDGVGELRRRPHPLERSDRPADGGVPSGRSEFPVVYRG